MALGSLCALVCGLVFPSINDHFLCSDGAVGVYDDEGDVSRAWLLDSSVDGEGVSPLIDEGDIFVDGCRDKGVSVVVNDDEMCVCGKHA